MMKLARPRRRVPKPDLIGPHQSDNPMFSPDSGWSSFRRRVLVATLICLVITVGGFIIFGPWLSINNVVITGTRLINVTSIRQTTEKYLDGRRWLFFPNRSLAVLSDRGLAKHLESQIRRRLSIDSVTVKITRPHSISITIVERTPVANWLSGATIGTVDKEGKIIELRTSPDVNLPIVHDESENIFTIDSSVVKVDVISSLIDIANNLRQANIGVGEFLIPYPECPVPILNNTDITTNNTNMAVDILTNIPTNIPSLNTNSMPTLLPTCDREALRFSSQEIHVQIVDGPRVLFDRHSNIQQAVQALKRVLTERINQKYILIDVRFDDRVYLK